MISGFEKEKVFWTNKMNIRLVKFIQKRPSIWNPKHPKYTSAIIKDKIYNEFASIYGDQFTGQAVKDRWTNIRCTFANYYRKLKASQAKPDGEEYKISWHLWEPCQFLLKVYKKGKDEASTPEHSTEEEFENEESIPDNYSDEEKDLANEIPKNLESPKCENIAESLLQVFRGVQNDVFGIDKTQHGKVGRIVAKALSRMEPFNAAKASTKIMEILQFYHEHNPLNGSQLKSEYNN